MSDLSLELLNGGITDSCASVCLGYLSNGSIRLQIYRHLKMEDNRET